LHLAVETHQTHTVNGRNCASPPTSSLCFPKYVAVRLYTTHSTAPTNLILHRILNLASKLFAPKSSFAPVKIVSTEKRVRGILNGHVIFDTTGAKLVWEHRYFPYYWIPKADFTDKATFVDDKPLSGIQQSTSELTAGKDGKSLKALVVPESFNSELAGLVKVDFKELDAAYEEMQQILYHPKDPFHRVDCLPSGRHVKVEIEGTLLADTGTEGGVMSLWETNFPGR
jgi:uncharacterized protein (DUF427 family)